LIQVNNGLRRENRNQGRKPPQLAGRIGPTLHRQLIGASRLRDECLIEFKVHRAGDH
jgi:hypothetical protein